MKPRRATKYRFLTGGVIGLIIAAAPFPPFPPCPSDKEHIESVTLLFCSSVRMVMEEGKQRDRGRGCPPGPEGKRLFIELGELNSHLKI